jgi:excisionase family DNA binding protein
MDQPQSPQLPELFTSRQVARLLKVCRRTVWRKVQRGELPQPLRLGRRLVRWRADEIRAYLETLTAARPGRWLSHKSAG